MSGLLLAENYLQIILAYSCPTIELTGARVRAPGGAIGWPRNIHGLSHDDMSGNSPTLTIGIADN